MPNGLTPYEYYRLGVRLSSDSWHSEIDLRKARAALNKAFDLDKNGVTGNLAHNYDRSQLPTIIPNQATLDWYDTGIRYIWRGDQIRALPALQMGEASSFEWKRYATKDAERMHGPLQLVEQYILPLARVNNLRKKRPAFSRGA